MDHTGVTPPVAISAPDLVDVALRAALGTGAGIRMIPGAGGPTGGVGAILRWG